MLYRDILAVCCKNHQNVECFNVKRGVTYSDHWALKGQ
jgi:hypothetical protein